MKIVYILLAIAIIVGLYLAFANRSDAPATTLDSVTPDVGTMEDQTTDVPTEVPSVDVETETGDISSTPPPSPVGDKGGESTVVTLDAFNYSYSQSEIIVRKGETVTINLTVSDGFHDWVVDEFDAATEKISAGGTTSVTFVADKVGTYEFYCSVGDHRAQGMVGTLVVQ